MRNKRKVARLALTTMTLVLAFTAAGRAAEQDPAAQQSQQKAHTIIEQAIAALGGDAWLHRRDAAYTGRSAHFYQGKPSGDIVSFWQWRQYPDKERFEFTKKRDVATIYTGDEGWDITYKGKQPLPAKQVDEHRRNRAHSLEVLLVDWVRDPATVLIYEGQTQVERHLADKVSLINAQNDSATIEFDAQTHLPLRRSYQWRDPLYRDKNEETEEYDDYHPFDGVDTPFTVARFHNGDMTGQIFLFTAGYNHGVPPDAFDVDATARKLKK